MELKTRHYFKHYLKNSLYIHHHLLKDSLFFWGSDKNVFVVPMYPIKSELVLMYKKKISAPRSNNCHHFRRGAPHQEPFHNRLQSDLQSPGQVPHRHDRHADPQQPLRSVLARQVPSFRAAE